MGNIAKFAHDRHIPESKKSLADQLQIERVYFAGYHLTTEKPKLKKEKKQAKEQPIKTSTKKNKTKKRKKRNKNKRYHPHYLKGKK